MSAPGRVEFSVLADVDATDFFVDAEGDESVNWDWCVANATFSHKDACEFVVHIGDAAASMEASVVESMKEAGCTEDFINAYQSAARAGAMRVLFHA